MQAESLETSPARLAYLTSLYPATSHTFIRREVAALRNLGLSIDTFSIRAPAPEELQDPQDAEDAKSTFTLLRQPAFAFMRAHAGLLFRYPVRYLKILLLALSHRPPGLRGLLLALAHFAESILLAHELKRRAITHLHNHFANSAATVGLLASRFLEIGWSFTIHGISETDYPAGLLLPRKVEAADLVICASWFGRAQAMRTVAPAHWAKLHVVRCGVALDQLPSRSVAGSEGIRTVTVGRLSPEKGHAGLLEAFAVLAKDHPAARLRLVGSGPEEQALQALSRSLGIVGQVEFVGRLSESEALAEISRSDILVLPSLMEGLPVVLMEAMALGVPVIASQVAGIPELVQHDRDGLLFTAGRWDELRNCMGLLMTDNALRDRLSQNARATIEAEFDVSKSAQKLAALFASNANRHRLEA